MRSIFLNDGSSVPYVWHETQIKVLKAEFGLDDKVYKKSDLNSEDFKDVVFIFSTWGMPSLSSEEIKTIFPSLEAVFYAAGSVQYFARPFIESGVMVFSAWAANAVPVAEFATAQIILAAKGYFSAFGVKSAADRAEKQRLSHMYPGNYRVNVGILGAGQIGKLVIKLLKQNYNVKIKVFDPFLPDSEAGKLGVEKTDMETIFFTCTVISNHLANNKDTQKIINRKCLEKMLPYAVFINTGRGAQVDDEALIDVLKSRPGAAALLDVTDPEPLPDNHPFYGMKNVFITPHIAGSQENECERMAEYMLTEAKRLISGERCEYEVTLKMLETMA
ncbi:MAG: hydroxyacid dehydrogenase [Eubacteriales bacterium]|jgi:phosphoglycerate dehydrogenase-like enzyme